MEIQLARSLARAALLCFVLSTSASVHAQQWPVKPVRLIVPFAAGGATDTVVRIVAARLPEALGQQVVVDNRTGAGGLIGTEIAARASPDGYTFLATGTPHVIVPHLYKKAAYDPVKDFDPIMEIGTQPYAITVHPSLGVSSVKELIALAKQQPGKINYASSGNGGAQHLFAAMFVSMAGIDMVHVPYKDSGIARADLLGGQVKVGCLGVASIINQHKAGQLRIVGVTSAKRSPELPDIPSIAESVPGYDASLWTGIFAPRGTSAAAMKRIHAEVTKLLQTAEAKAAYARVGTYPVATNPAEFGEYVKKESAKWGKVVRDINLQIN
jgi:tripartite-type tricarboxylate transporter receptor subunit TctC